jgi:hypothetical protein
LISNIDASEMYTLYKASMNFTISLKAFPERPKLKQLFLLENLEVNRRINFFVKIK